MQTEGWGVGGYSASASAQWTDAPFSPRAHVFGDEVASDFNVSLCNDSGVGRNHRVQPGK